MAPSGGGEMFTIPRLSGDKQTSGERAATAALDPERSSQCWSFDELAFDFFKYATP
jgi:hypothetical protein